MALVAAEGGHNASMAQNILEVSYTGSSYIANELKTIMALSALTVTSFVLLEELWPDTTEEMTGVTNYQLLECSREMFEMVSCEQTDVLSSVNFKYSTPALRLTFPHHEMVSRFVINGSRDIAWCSGQPSISRSREIYNYQISKDSLKLYYRKTI